MALVKDNVQAVIGSKWDDDTKAMDWMDCYPIVDGDTITGVVLAGDTVPEELTFDTQDECYRNLGWETVDDGTDRERLVARYNGHILEVYEEGGTWCWRTFGPDEDDTGDVDGDVADSMADAKRMALDAAK